MEIVKKERKESDRQDELMTNKKVMDGKASDDADVREKKKCILLIVA